MCVTCACTCDQLKRTLHVAARVMCASPAKASSAKTRTKCYVFLSHGFFVMCPDIHGCAALGPSIKKHASIASFSLQASRRPLVQSVWRAAFVRTMLHPRPNAASTTRRARKPRFRIRGAATCARKRHGLQREIQISISVVQLAPHSPRPAMEVQQHRTGHSARL